MKKMIICVFSFIFLVMGFAIFLIVLYTPVKTPTAFDNTGFMLYEDGSTENCDIRLGGTMVTFRMNVDTPYFYSNPLSNKEGLIVDQRRHVIRFTIGWQEEDDDYVTFVSNGVRFFTNRALSFVVAIIPDGTGANRVAVAPAPSTAEAKALIETVVNNQDIQFRSPSACDYLRTYLE